MSKFMYKYDSLPKNHDFWGDFFPGCIPVKAPEGFRDFFQQEKIPIFQYIYQNTQITPFLDPKNIIYSVLKRKISNMICVPVERQKIAQTSSVPYKSFLICEDVI